MTAREIEEFVRRSYEAFNAGGLAMAREFWHPEVVYEDDPRWPGGGRHTGFDAVYKRFEDVIEVLGVRSARVERVVAREGEGAWVVSFTGESGAEGVPNEHTWGYFARFEDGLIAHCQAFYDADEAIAAFEDEG